MKVGVGEGADWNGDLGVGLSGNKNQPTRAERSSVFYSTHNKQRHIS